MDLAGERARIRGVLERAAVTGIIDDPRNVNPPCVLIGLPAAIPADDHLAMVATPVYVIAPGPGNADAVAELLSSLNAVTTALGDPSTEPGAAGIPAQGSTAYTVTVMTRLARAICLEE